ncbi:hypothetical protein HHI36_010879 [Cryptolaemus montrouzieri]|uniref:Probable RNA-binding protein EIF1AD n=1 Tax=Cryptolaemus montrouzieri TaxID=559131 RepID=A0ABD2MK56_9CUCU
MSDNEKFENIEIKAEDEDTQIGTEVGTDANSHVKTPTNIETLSKTNSSKSDMSRANKRKHVMREMQRDDFAVPTENQQIVRITASRGNNLHEVEAPDQSKFLISMPTKFRRNIWVKRGDFVLIDPIQEGGKVKGEMVKKLTSEHIKNFKKDNVWPEQFNDGETKESDEIPENNNRIIVFDDDSDDSSNSSFNDF